ncbi:hypothetical protein [Aromatoleum diolicum]|uniref:PilZ domain-containing protein n=1 Tax=Aromatoleum diolicum TaxID=75796 RepID=A0ABX1QHX6_9RHOO|nr:hypothetical protein [Aromatoleum diolicum]NMG76829.1 hypothetical protein [Aromatoleum diolicum]
MSVDDEVVSAARQCSETAQAGGGDLLHELEACTARVHHLMRADGLSVDTRFEALARLDDEARAGISRLRGSHAAQILSTVSAVAAGRDMFGAILDAYQGCIYAYEDEASHPARRGLLEDCRVRLVRAGAERVLWERFSGGPAHEHLWRWLGAAFREVTSPDGGHYSAGPGVPEDCTVSVKREYLRAVAAQSASFDLLQPQLIHVVDRLLDFALPMFQFQAAPFAGATYYVDPDWSVGPRRMVRLPESINGTWFFAPRMAAEALQEVAEQLAVGNLPKGLTLGQESDDSLKAGLEHVLRHWSDMPPVRRYRRHLLGGTLSAVRGIKDLQRLFSGQNVTEQAEWSLRDVSRGGLGVYAPMLTDGSVRVGELVGICPIEGATWQLAIVRRTWANPGGCPFVGLETLTQRPVLTSVDDGRASADVVMCDPLMRGEAVRIAAPANVLNAGVPLFVTSNGSIQKLKPLESSMTGDGFELRVYQVL